MSRWKQWRKVNGESLPGQFSEPRIDSTEVLLVAYVTPPSTEVQECRTVTVSIDHGGGVTVAHGVTPAPENDDGGALYPSTTTELYVPGWGESNDWSDGDA